MRVAGNIFLAIGSGLGVWVITHLGDVGISDFAIVALFIAVGATLKHARNEQGGDE